jgi:Lrp/AsnC family leucine-responsive transcriptional regulator
MKFREVMFKLDDIDRQLLIGLQEDAKVSLGRLGERVGLSAPSVMERVRKLEQAGLIKGYHAVLDARAVGLDVASFIGVRVQSPTAIEAFEAWVEGLPEILECHHVTGSYTLLLKVKTRNTSALEQLIRRLRSFEGVASTDTMVVLSTRLERVMLPLEEEDGAEASRASARKRRRVS